MTRILAYSCPHTPVMHPKFPSFLEQTAEAWKVDKILCLGDLVDWTSISYHPTPISLKNSIAERKAAQKQVAVLYNLFPKTQWFIGNHDALTHRQAKDSGLADDLLKSYGDMWDVPTWTVHPRFSDVIIDGVMYRHGDKGRGGAMPAFANAKDNFCSTVQGHFHSSAGVLWGANSSMRYFGMQVGCGVDYRKEAMDYGVKYTKKPILGCGVIIDGIPYFEPMDLGNKFGILK